MVCGEERTNRREEVPVIHIPFVAYVLFCRIKTSAKPKALLTFSARKSSLSCMFAIQGRDGRSK